MDDMLYTQTLTQTCRHGKFDKASALRIVYSQIEDKNFVRGTHKYKEERWGGRREGITRDQ